MTKSDKRELYKQMVNDFNCGTFCFTPEFVDQLLRRKEKKVRRLMKRTIYNLQKLEKLLEG